ncbi:MAG: hypothetical protein V4581_01180 [Bacteroidota bacterium]
MSLLLYINGHLADLEPGQVIAQTRQVNDLNSLDNRQASYTNKFSLPKTATNIKLLDYLTVTGNSSNVPYQKNTCSLYSHTGECFVYNGWAVITDGGDSYDCVVYDGIIDLYKAIENKTLASLNLGEDLDHNKNMANVTASWNDANNYNYKYILADYNGRLRLPLTNIINIDYLIPSVKVSYLWHKIFTAHGFEYSGSIFQMQDFQNLYITFPKGFTTDDLNVTKFESEDYSFTFSNEAYSNKNYYARFTTATINTLPSFLNTHLKVQETGTYRLEVSGSITTNGRKSRVYLAKNAQGLTAGNTLMFRQLATQLASGDEFNASSIFTLNENDSIAVVIRADAGQWPGYSLNASESSLSVKLVRVDGNQVNFNEAFASLSIRDFLNEVVYRFGLTLHKDKYSNKYIFLTMQEQLQTTAIEDWSSKFVKKASENYLPGNYAQRNWFRYQYNTKEDTYNDAFIEVQNSNLPETRDTLKSKIYSPEKEPSRFRNALYSNIYKFWEKEPGEDTDEEGNTIQVINYKPLDNRFYFLKSIPQNFSPLLTLTSLNLGGTVVSVTSAPFESYWKLPFQDILQEYYGNIMQILDKPLVLTADFWLTDADLAAFDFKKLYYVEQLSSYFIMNKISNYVPNKITRCELVRVHYVPVPELLPAISLYKVVTAGTEVALHFNLINFSPTYVTVQYSPNGTTWYNTTGSAVSPRYKTLPATGEPLYIRVETNGVVSNTVIVDIPSNVTIEI